MLGLSYAAWHCLIWPISLNFVSRNTPTYNLCSCLFFAFCHLSYNTNYVAIIFLNFVNPLPLPNVKSIWAALDFAGELLRVKLVGKNHSSKISLSILHQLSITWYIYGYAIMYWSKSLHFVRNNRNVLILIKLKKKKKQKRFGTNKNTCLLLKEE